MFGDERRREINLGGARAIATQQAVLSQVQQERERRRRERERLHSSSVIQAWWRAHAEASRTRSDLLKQFDQEPKGTLTSTRLLIFGGGERGRLLNWTNAALSDGDAFLSERISGSEANSWLALLKQLAFMMLKQVTNDPTSSDAEILLKFLTSITAKRSTSQIILQYLIDREMYSKLSYCIRSIPVQKKPSAATLSGLIALSVAPFKAFTSASPTFSHALRDVIIHLLTISLFANRLPMSSLTLFASQVPFAAFHLVSSSEVAMLIPEDATILHLLANLLTFMPPRYTSTSVLSLKGPALTAYIGLLIQLIGRLPIGAFELQKKKGKDVMDWTPQSDSDDEKPRVAPKVEEVPSISPPDGRTANKLTTLISPAHITSLLLASNANASSWLQFVELVIVIGAKWPKKREGLLTTIAIGHGSVVFKQLWKDSVRSSQLGKDENGLFLKDPNAYKDDWPPLLLLTELYTQALLTMGDDEFFSTTAPTKSTSKTGTTAAKNPFNIGEVIQLSRHLLNIVFPLYWNDPPRTSSAIPISWDIVKERITKCLQAIHARDSRRPFTPPRHWLVIEQTEVRSFVDAAIAEEQKLDEEEDTTRQLSKRDVAYLSPRLGILNNIPFAIPFESRVSIFHSFIHHDQFKTENSGHGMGTSTYRNKVVVRRDHVSQDGFDHLNELGAAWKGRLAITFVDKFGQEEAGIDGGGVFKEFLTSLSREVFDTNRGLWLATKQQELYPNSHSYAKEPHQLNWYRFIGRVLGKALYEGILVDVTFAGFFLAKWLGKQSFLDDLASLDPELYQGLIFLKNYTGNPEELSLDFTITEEDLGVTRTVELKQDGATTPVTRENRLEYIYLVAHYRLTHQIRKQSAAFFEGLSELIEPRWLRMFNQQELQILVGGAEEPIDVDDLKSNVVYGGLYDEDHPTIRMFWRVVKNMDESSRRLLLRFVTSCARPPLLGFKELNPKFAIRDAGIDTARLPTASTCVNLLKLPLYQDEDTLRRKMLHAINAGAGFDLSTKADIEAVWWPYQETRNFTIDHNMGVLVAAAPLYFSISTGLFSLYLFFASAHRSLGSRQLASFCLLVPFLLAVDSVVALVILGTEGPSLDLVQTEYVLLVVVRLALNLMTALLLHPDTLSHFLGRPALAYKSQAAWVWTIGVIAIFASIVDAAASFVVAVSSMTLLVGAFVPPLTFVLLLRVAAANRKWNSSSSKFCWDLLAALQLPALAISILRAWSGNAMASTVGHFCLFIWTAGTLISVSNLTPFTPSKSPKRNHLGPRRTSHTTVSEDFQSNRDPFAGPLALGMGHQRRYHLPPIPASAAYMDTYDEIDDRSSHKNRGAIRTQYSSESSTRWLLSQPHIQSLPSLPPPVHLEPPAQVGPRTLTGAESTLSLPLPPVPDPMASATVSRDRTPTQSLYVPESLPRNILGENCDCLFMPQPDTGSLPSIPSFELDTPDQTFSSEVDTSSTDTNESIAARATFNEESLAMRLASEGDVEKEESLDDKPAQRHH